MERNKKAGSKLDTRVAFWADKLTDASWLDQFAQPPATEIPEPLGLADLEDRDDWADYQEFDVDNAPRGPDDLPFSDDDDGDWQDDDDGSWDDDPNDVYDPVEVDG